MKLLKFLTCFYFLFNAALLCKAQGRVDNYDFSKVDSAALRIKYQNDIYKLANDLTEPYAEDIYKIRAIFRWITNNIKYDYKFINKDKEIEEPDCGDVIDCSGIIREWNEKLVLDVLRKRKAICTGYALLFKKLCNINDIACEVINGYVKQKPYEIGNRLSVNHAWNAIMIDGKWYYFDATWAAGFTDEDEETGKLTGFRKKYKDYYWCTPFERLVRNHYPQNGKWVETTNLTKEKFFNFPHYYTYPFLVKISNEQSPASGIIETKLGDTIRFVFDYVDTLNKLQINSNVFSNWSIWEIVKKGRKYIKRIDNYALKKQVYIPFSKKENTYSFIYIVTDKSLYYIDILIDYKKAMRYKVKVIE